MKRTAMAVVLLLTAVVVAGCIDDSITGTRPLSFSMSASATTVVVNTDVTFAYEATGTQLQYVWVDYGDGAADTVPLGGNILLAEGSLTHAFGTTGSFAVSGGARGSAGTETQQVTIQVN